MSELDIRGILEELSRADVEFLIIGGVAVGFHGYIRATKDVDGYEELIALKEDAGRPEDLIDLQRLRQARGEE